MMKNEMKNEVKKFEIPSGRFHEGDMFRCHKCGYTERILTLSNHSICPNCGGWMYRL